MGSRQEILAAVQALRSGRVGPVRTGTVSAPPGLDALKLRANLPGSKPPTRPGKEAAPVDDSEDAYVEGPKKKSSGGFFGGWGKKDKKDKKDKKKDKKEKKKKNKEGKKGSRTVSQSTEDDVPAPFTYGGPVVPDVA